jgi:hypothetical protein
MFAGVWLGVLVGFVGAAFWVPRFRKTRKETWVAFRPAGDTPPGTPYRDGRTAELRTRTAEEVLAAVRAGGLRVREISSGFEVHGEGRWLTVHMHDRSNVTLDSLEIIDRATETLVFELALVLVPLYGPILVKEAKFGSAVVDGSLDVEALRAGRAERIRKIVRGVLDDMEDMQRTHGGGAP